MNLHVQSDQTDNHLEFEVPPTAISQDFHSLSSPKTQRPFSIDLSLELERQLDMESPPVTPAYHTQTHDTCPKRESLDPQVLAHIVMQLRQSLAEMTKERDDLLQLVSGAHLREAELKDTLQALAAKATELEEELMAARRQMKDDEDAIAMLRTKVEESRRGLMRLQSENQNRRQSVGPMPLDLSRAGFNNYSTPGSSKRASFTPATGSHTTRPNAHRRISSVSDTCIDDQSSQTLIIPPELSANSSRRISGFHNRSPQADKDAFNLELEALRKELRAARDELEETKHELSEANEAKEASDTCVNALREFISENNVGTVDLDARDAVKLPPLPATTTGDEMEAKKVTTGWGFKLWKADTSVKPASGPTSITTASTASPVIASSPQLNPSQVPLTRKIGGFFSSRGSVSSNSPLQSNAAVAQVPHRDSVYSFSDASSMNEPLSPMSEESPHNDVVVRSLSDMGSQGGSLPPFSNGVAMHVEKEVLAS
ncbi:uncharacterized protein BT62DRAFT_934858 [Guyanagaster necrorhizus]|uniref:Uncharacterized protein n=1 Tax=Guyanagaster necrorhizus TaxID=856835 RepID=A0A9P7VN56_9AGAR|nr:uncharacterized protein BT62DRAFT_934858 [Guyanagaster necrorhizus MCA 3950]KAG7443620.1 hypothetical protein BT62DRAFT_934858 [Guyanagaster necrorhizus MCA 3950]